jgi:hypothetical protein
MAIARPFPASTVIIHMITIEAIPTTEDPYDACWAHGLNPSQPCWGKLDLAEYTHGFYAYFCEGHGNPLHAEPYKPEPVKERAEERLDDSLWQSSVFHQPG